MTKEIDDGHSYFKLIHNKPQFGNPSHTHLYQHAQNLQPELTVHLTPILCIGIKLFYNFLETKVMSQTLQHWKVGE